MGRGKKLFLYLFVLLKLEENFFQRIAVRTS
jgi:hypothetical protein